MRPTVPRHIFEGSFVLDDAQAAAADLLSSSGEQGIYLWGPVGRGKTWLLDRYFGAVRTDAKKRVHFHSFFRDLHVAYARHGFSIDKAVAELTDGLELLCFDEFHVHDIGDARLIARMLDSLFGHGVTLVVTSNYPPERLMPNPLFHDAFLPTIAVLKKHLRVVAVDGPVDYRTTARTDSPLAAQSWNSWAAGSWRTAVPASDSGVTFEDLCCAPKSTGDYLALADRVEHLTITDIPRMSDMTPYAAQRFANLVDILYDRDVRTDFHARVPVHRFADGCRGLDIDRIVSRLCELKNPAATSCVALPEN